MWLKEFVESIILFIQDKFTALVDGSGFVLQNKTWDGFREWASQYIPFMS